MKTIYDLMSKNVVTVKTDTNLNEIIKIMKEKGVGKLPVLDDNNLVVGVITRDDLLIKNEKAPMPPVIALNDLFFALTKNKQFKEKYEKEKSVTIKSLAAELLNNKVVSSSDKFVYKFTYIISKGNEEFLCIATNVEINKIENNYIFKNFANLQEECILK